MHIYTCTYNASPPAQARLRPPSRAAARGEHLPCSLSRPRAPYPRGRVPSRPERRAASARRNPFHPRLKPRNPETPSRAAARQRPHAPCRSLGIRRVASTATPVLPPSAPVTKKRGRPVSRCAPSRLLVAHDAVVHDLVPSDVPARIARDGEAVALLSVDRVVGGTRLRHGANHLRS